MINFLFKFFLKRDFYLIGGYKNIRGYQVSTKARSKTEAWVKFRTKIPWIDLYRVVDSLDCEINTAEKLEDVIESYKEIYEKI